MSPTASGYSSRLQRTYPEWWVLLISAIAWLVLLSWPNHANDPSMCPPIHRGQASWWFEQSLGWLLMIIAMMFPMATSHVRSVAARSFWNRRNRAISTFLLGFLSTWSVMGLLMVGAGAWLVKWTDAAVITVFTLLVAVGWQFAPWKKWAILACHRTRSFAPRGWRGDWELICYGAFHGYACSVSCIAMMALMLPLSHNGLLMITITGVGLQERTRMNRRNRDLILTVSLIVAGAATAPILAV